MELIVIFLAIASTVLAVLALAGFLVDGTEAERMRIEMEVRRAERRLHDIARDSFHAMLEEARSAEGGGELDASRHQVLG